MKKKTIQMHYVEKEALSNLTADIAYCGTKGEIDQSIRMFLQLIYKICDPPYDKTTRKLHTAKTYGKRDTPWFDEECKLLRQHFYRQLHSFWESNNTLNRTRMLRARSDFKHAIKMKKYVHEVLKTEKLVQYR